MNYQNVYNQIIERGKTRHLEGYKEKHHIIPKCLGGSNDKENIVELTAREHFLCHRLLVEIHPNKSLKYALWLMTIGKQQKFKHKINSRTYERLKTEIAELTRERFKGKKISEKHIESIRNYHKGKKRDEQWKNNMRCPKKNTENMKHPKSEITKKRISEGMTGKKWKISEQALINRKKVFTNDERNTKISNKNNQEVNQYSIDGKFIKTFKSITEANLMLNKKPCASSISLCCKDIYSQAFGFKWKKKNHIN